MAPLTETSAVSIRFGSLRAVDSVSLAVDRGEVVGLLGANGSGKTTLIRLLLGLLRPSSGTASLFGLPPSIATRQRVGYVPQTLGLYGDLTVQENWAFTASAFDTGRHVMPESVRTWGDELAGTLPLGVQRRVAFALAFSHRPELLVLDEPTSGVGPLSRARLWQDIRGASEHGAGVLVTTHNMEEAEQCDRLVVMVDGRVATSGTVTEIVGGLQVVEVRADDWRRAYEAIVREGFVVDVQGELLRVDAPEAAVDRLLFGEGVQATTRVAEANFEEAFIAVVTGSRRG